MNEQHQLLRKVRLFGIFGAAIFVGSVFLFGLLGLLAWAAVIAFLWHRSKKHSGI
ncbi:MAG: hypothetical protein OSB62_05365 [Alphaproteobacteria bacterium]|nr:hypothetical protein [Alphaproteobacteria bacterium]